MSAKRGTGVSIRSLLFAGYLGALALLLLAWAVASAGADALRANYAYTVHTTDALTSVALQGSKLRDDEETGLRGYLLTGQRQFLQPYLAAQPALAALRQQATALAADEPAIRPVLLTARRLADAWDLWARGVLEHSTAIPHSAPAIIAQQEYGKALFDRYRAATAQLLALLDQDRQDNFAAGLAQLSAVNRTFAILFASATAMLTLLGWRATRAVTRPLDSLGRAAQAIGRGELARPVAVRGNREFTRLAADMDVMRRQLVAREEALRARETELAASEGQLRAVYGTMACGVMVVNPDGVLVEANAAACEILGAPREALLGHTLAETTGPSAREDGSALALAERPSSRALTTGQPVRDVAFRLTRLDGAARWLRTDAVPLLDERGAVRQVVASFVDVTAGREARAALRVAEERLRMVVDHAPIVLSALDRDGIFTLVEGRGLAMRGRTSASVVGRSIFDLYAGVAPVQEGVRRALAGETVATTADVAGLAFETHYTPLRDADGAVTGVIGVSADVTERLRAEEALRAELERQAAIVSIQQAVATAEAVPDALRALINLRLRARVDARSRGGGRVGGRRRTGVLRRVRVHGGVPGHATAPRGHALGPLYTDGGGPALRRYGGRPAHRARHVPPPWHRLHGHCSAAHPGPGHGRPQGAVAIRPRLRRAGHAVLAARCRAAGGDAGPDAGLCSPARERGALPATGGNGAGGHLGS